MIRLEEQSHSPQEPLPINKRLAGNETFVIPPIKGIPENAFMQLFLAARNLGRPISTLELLTLYAPELTLEQAGNRVRDVIQSIRSTLKSPDSTAFIRNLNDEKNRWTNKGSYILITKEELPTIEQVLAQNQHTEPDLMDRLWEEKYQKAAKIIQDYTLSNEMSGRPRSKSEDEIKRDKEQFVIDFSNIVLSFSAGPGLDTFTKNVDELLATIRPKGRSIEELTRSKSQSERRSFFAESFRNTILRLASPANEKGLSGKERQAVGYLKQLGIQNTQSPALHTVIATVFEHFGIETSQEEQRIA